MILLLSVNLRVGVYGTVHSIYMKRGYYASPPTPLSPDKIPIRNAVLCEADSVRVRLRKRGTGGAGGREGVGGLQCFNIEMLFPLGYCTWST
jgi:hypothetical protein